MNDTNYDVFISCAHEDQDVARLLAKACTANGLRAWFAPSEMQEGSGTRAAVKKAIDESRLYLVLFSESTKPNNSWLSFEWSAIQKAVWDRDTRAIVPIQVGEEVELPAFLRHWRSLRLDSATPHLDLQASNIVRFIKSGSPGTKVDEDSDTSTATRFEILSEWISQAAIRDAPKE